jgi:hypothetical protein
MDCCINCFKDRFIRGIINDHSKSTGECSFCGSKNVNLYDPAQLSDPFQMLLDLYNECTDNKGKDLAEQIQNDWAIFSNYKKTTCTLLLTMICPDRFNPKLKYQPKYLPEDIQIEKWNKFREELKHQNRFFPSNGPNTDHLKELFGFLKIPDDESPKDFYRARIKRSKIPFTMIEMRKPPKESIPNGRANPNGISCLYTASDVDTAIHEVRPHRGDLVVVAHFSTSKSILLADLRNPKNTISPFELGDHLADLYKEMPFLTVLGNELSKPVVPSEADLEYLPSQYLCELVKSMGYKGIIYKSSLAEGDNYALFDDSDLLDIDMREYVVTRNRVDFDIHSI